MAETDPVDLPDDFDRLLRQELSVEPSPALAARIRADAMALRQRGVWTAWLLPLAGAAALVVAALVWMPTIDGPGTRLPPAVPAPAVVPSSAPVRVEQPRVAQKPSATADLGVDPPRPVRRRPARAVPAAVAASAPVVVDQNQRAALATLVAMIDQGRLTAEAFAKTTPLPTGSIVDQVVPITIAPVPVSAISPGGVLQNDTQRK